MSACRGEIALGIRLQNGGVVLNPAHPEVLSDPEPQIQFLTFGDSSLNFDLLVWIADPTRQYFVISDLNFAIVQAFRARDITIPFPQRDLHIKSAVPIARSPSEGDP